MTFSKEIIALIDALAERLGIVIDWTAENVMPYLTDLASRFITLTIWKDAIWAVILLAGLAISVLILRKGLKMQIEDDQGDKYYDSDIYIALQIAGVILTIIFLVIDLIFIPGFINNILDCIFLPEKAILDYLKPLVAATATA